MRFRSRCAGAGSSRMPLAAQAQPFQGLYIGAGAGVYWPENINVQTAVLGSSRAQFDPSVGFAGLAQRRLRPGQRVPLRTGGQLSQGQHLSRQRARFADFQRHAADLWRDGQCAVRHGCRRAMAVSLRRWWRRLCLDPLAQSRRDAPGWRRRLGVITSNDTEGGLRFPGDRRPVVPDSRVPGLSLTAEYRFFGIAGGRIICRLP